MIMKKFNKSHLFFRNNRNIFALTIIGIFGLFLLRGAFYGVATPDESFYLTIPYRVILGDSLLIDEWHASQISSFLLYLPMKLFISITGGTDGIILFFRCLFVFCQIAVSCFTYIRLKKYGTVPAMFSALLFLTYVTEQVHMLDYYTMSLMGFQVTVLMLFTDEKLSKPKLIFSGIVFACTVTAQPFNCLIYFIYTVFAAIFFIINKKRKKTVYTSDILSPDKWVFITIGIVITAIVFAAFLLSQASAAELISNIDNLFSGQDHNLPFSAEADSDMFSYFTIIKTLFSFAPVSFILSFITTILCAADKNRAEHRKIWLTISLCIICIYTIAIILGILKNPAAMLFRPYPLFLLTLIIILLKKNINKELLFLWFSGVAYIALLGIISQALDYVGAIGCVLSNTALMPAAKELYEEIISEKTEKIYPQKNKNKNKKSRTKAVFIVPAVLCSICIIFGTAAEFIDDPTAMSLGRQPEAGTVTLSDGPLKGIKVGKIISEEYSAILADMKTIRENTDERVLVAELIPWTYFCSDAPPAAFTTWYIDNELYMFDSYYEDESHRPGCIYIPETSFYWGTDNINGYLSTKTFFKKMFKGEIEKGNIGDIFYIDKIR